MIIVSTVRSQVEFVKFDLQYNIGFLSDPKRFNVAITRAQALVIVIGNPQVLYSDTHWKAYIDFCIENSGYTGCAFVPHGKPKDDEKEVLQRVHEALGSLNPLQADL